MKILTKYMRKFHRWLVIPFILVIVLMPFMRDTATGDIIQKVQQIMMLTLAISGAYLYLLPYLTKWQRKKKRKVAKKIAADGTVKVGGG